MLRFAILSAVAGVALNFGVVGAADDSDPTNQENDVVPAKAADGDAPLPEGFPGATAPESIEVKTYPPYRSAVARAEAISANAGDTLFFSLFNHITRSGVAMTAPVINSYGSEEMVADPKQLGDVSMEFLYETPDQGEAGPGVGIVRVEDHPEITVVSLGVQGAMSDASMQSGLAKLRSWLDANGDRWEVAGPPRRLGYHGPMTPVAQRLWEIQIPVRPAETK